MRLVIHTVRNHMRRKQPARRVLSDGEVHVILVKAMAYVGADPALVFAFATTGVYVGMDNERNLSRRQKAAWKAAIQQCFELLAGNGVV